MKREVYILLVMLLGLMLSTLVHAGLEVPALRYLVDPGVLTWPTWKAIHAVATPVLAVGGLIGGWFLGRVWWRIVYAEGRRFGRKRASGTMRT